MVRPGAAGGGIKARRIGEGRNAQNTAALRRALRAGVAAQRHARYRTRYQRHRLAPCCTWRQDLLLRHGIVLRRTGMLSVWRKIRSIDEMAGDPKIGCDFAPARRLL